MRRSFVTQNKIVITSQRSKVRSHEDRSHKKVKRDTVRNCHHMSQTVGNKSQMRSHCCSERNTRETLSKFYVSLPGASLFHGHWRLLSECQPHLLTVNEIKLIKQIRILLKERSYGHFLVKQHSGLNFVNVKAANEIRKYEHFPVDHNR